MQLGFEGQSRHQLKVRETESQNHEPKMQLTDRLNYVGLEPHETVVGALMGETLLSEILSPTSFTGLSGLLLIPNNP